MDVKAYVDYLQARCGKCFGRMNIEKFAPKSGDKGLRIPLQPVITPHDCPSNLMDDGRYVWNQDENDPVHYCKNCMSGMGGLATASHICGRPLVTNKQYLDWL